jgi:hypothetical protein
LLTIFCLKGASAQTQPFHPFTPIVPDTTHLLDASQSVNGLAARIENAGDDLLRDEVVFVRLMNTGPQTLLVPADNPEQGPAIFTLEAQIGDAWVATTWLPKREESVRGEAAPPGSRSPPELELTPGESALLAFRGEFAERLSTARQLRVLIQRESSSRRGLWTGAMRTPPRPVWIPKAAMSATAGTLDFPTQLPALGHIETARYLDNSRGSIGNESSNKSVFAKLQRDVGRKFAQLAQYKSTSVRVEMERRLASEADVQACLLYAVEAAARGSVPARAFFEKQLRSTAQPIVDSVSDALVEIARRPHPPDWIWKALYDRMLDGRELTAIPSNWRSTTELTIGYLADEHSDIALALGQLGRKDAVPALIQVVETTKHIERAVRALGDLGDPQAIPILLKVVQRHESNVSIFSGMLAPGPFAAAVVALGELRATDATPILLRHLIHPDVIEALERIGDRRAIPALQEIVSRKPATPRRTLPIGEARKLQFSARLALVTLEQKDPTPAYIALLEDRSADKFQRRDALWRLGAHPDPKAIPALVRAIQTDPAGAVANEAITILAERYPYEETISGLIDCFEASFAGKEDWKRAATPATFHKHLAEALRHLTGQGFGPDKSQWRTWWRSIKTPYPAR